MLCTGESNYNLFPDNRIYGDSRCCDTKENIETTSSVNNNAPLFMQFEHRVAGHYVILVDKISGRLYKPSVKFERRFYEAAQTELQPLIPIIPKYFGLHKLDKPEGKINGYLIVENLTEGYKAVSALDIKVGKLQYIPVYTPEKIIGKKMKAFISTSNSLGFRISGMKAYRPVDEEYFHFSKEEGMRATCENVAISLKQFYFNGETYRTDVMEYHIERLKQYYNVIQNQRKWLLISSSLLLVYDGLHSQIKADLRAIDFANTVMEGEYDDITYEMNQYDEGILNLIKELTKAYESCFPK